MSEQVLNRCDECQFEMGEKDGGLCIHCTDRLHFERGQEWWADE